MNRAERRRQQNVERKAKKKITRNAPGALREALRHHQAGKLAEARRIYDQLLAIEPEHAEALHLAGVLNSQMGDHDKGAALIGRAISVRPDYAEAHHNLGNVLYQQGASQDALGCFRRAVELAPDYGEAHYNIASLLRLEGKLDEALDALTRAEGSGLDDAEIALERGDVLAELGRHEEAAQSYADAVARAPDEVEMLLGLAEAMRERRRIAEAAACVERALSCEPGNVAAHATRGHLLHEQGRADEAVASYRLALELDPANAELHRQLLRASAGKRKEADIDAARAQLESGNLSETDGARLGFALGDAAEDGGDFDEAFARFEAANAALRSTFEFDIAHEEAIADALIETCTKAFATKHKGAGHASGRPVFVLGMPRSGTSLVEQILASHADVFGAGEVNLARPALFEEFPQTEGQSVGDFLKGLRDEDLTRAGERYDARLGALGGGAKFVTDKYLNNFWYAGLIRLMLPEATLIHCRRDPLDTCVSCWTNLFRGEMRFAYDLAEIGQYYRIYDRLMKHWAKVPGTDLVEMRYEELVADPDGQIARLLDACGLDPDPACARFFETERFVGTLSALQVRQPVHTGSVGRAAHFEGRLAPLIEALGPLGESRAKPASKS
jgi:tetratricopeptide (TPR) repeat protein